MQTYIDKVGSRERLTWLERMSRTPEMLGDGFDPEELSFVHPRVAITCWEGAAQVAGQSGSSGGIGGNVVKMLLEAEEEVVGFDVAPP